MKIDRVVTEISKDLGITVEIKGDKVSLSIGDFINLATRANGGANNKGKEKPEKATPDIILEILEDFEEGATMEDIRDTLKKDHKIESSPAEIRAMLKGMEQNDKITSEGQARGKKYLAAG